MGLLELCLMTLLSPQQPASQVPPTSTQPAPGTNAPAATAATADQDALLRAEGAGKAGDPADPAELARLARSADAAVAARAAWLLGKQQGPQALEPLDDLARTSPHADVRLQAMATLLRQGTNRSVATAIHGLDDPDARIRTVAAQLLGRLRSPAAVAPLLALLDRSSKADAGTTPATDLQAAILALNDMDAVAQLLPAATAVHASKASGCDQALTFYFQNLSPKLPAKDEATLLVSVLDHREAMLRRYAISRLAELRDATTATALERRLGAEGQELRPLLEIALAQVRQQQHGAETGGAAAPQGVLDRVSRRWQAMSEQQRLITAGFGGLLLVAVAAVVVLWRRRRAALFAEAAPSVTDLVAPSDDYLAAEAAAAAEAEAEAVDVDSIPGAFEGTAPADRATAGEPDWETVAADDDGADGRQRRS